MAMQMCSCAKPHSAALSRKKDISRWLLIRNILKPRGSRNWLWFEQYRKEKMAEKNPENMIPAEMDVAEFECNVCLEVPKSSPIFQCQEGHILCNDCHPKLSQCPVCRTGNLGSIKNLTAQKILGVPKKEPIVNSILSSLQILYEKLKKN